MDWWVPTKKGDESWPLDYIRSALALHPPPSQASHFAICGQDLWMFNRLTVGYFLTRCVYTHTYICTPVSPICVCTVCDLCKYPVLTQINVRTCILSHMPVHTLSCIYPYICLPTMYICIQWNVPLEVTSVQWILANAKQNSDRSLTEALHDFSWHEHLNYKNVNCSDHLKVWGDFF